MKKIAKTIMVQGTGSHVGKSVAVAAICRILKQDGYRVCPFKSQNMALNSFVTADGGEMGRAQVVQAEAAGIEPEVFMNPILIKPVADSMAQIIFMGKVVKNMTVDEYGRCKSYYINQLTETLDSLKKRFDVIVIEGAGSPAEINLLKRDIVNMKTAEIAQSPVILAGDIDRGGVFASFYGTVKLLPPYYRKYFKALLINKFRGDRSLLASGERWIENKLKIPVLGVIPYYRDIIIEEEDSVNLEKELDKRRLIKPSLPEEEINSSAKRRINPIQKPQNRANPLKVSVIYLPHISNFTDFNALDIEKDIMLNYCRTSGDLSRFDPDIIIIPGSKSTISDLVYLRNTGLESEIKKRAAAGTVIVGICGGFQMLGKLIKDEKMSESSNIKEIEGMGLVDMETDFYSSKCTRQVEFSFNSKFGELIGGKKLIRSSSNEIMRGYEIHMGISKFNAKRKSGGPVILPLLTIWPVNENSWHEDGVFLFDPVTGMKILGTYVHGIFDNSMAREMLFKIYFYKKKQDVHGISAGSFSSLANYQNFKQENYDKLAEHFRQNMDMEKFYDILNKGLN